MGIQNVSPKSDLILFLDDDVSIDCNYFKEVTKVFDEHPEAKAVAGYNPQKAFNRLENALKKIFFLGYLERLGQARIVSAYGNTYPATLNAVASAQWLPGVNMCYRRDVFKDQMFDQNLLGYTLAEDIDFTYRLYKRYPNGLFITPFAHLDHRASNIERAPTNQMSYINQVDHFYFFFKNLNTSYLNQFKFIWSLLGISILRAMNMIIKPNKNNYLKCKYFFKSLLYCLSNIQDIKEGKVRNFINQKI
jgi:GT2 family glycosyltransferase